MNYGRRNDTPAKATIPGPHEGTGRVIMGRNDYDEIAQYARTANAPATCITEELYEYLLNVLPPLSDSNARGGHFMSEMLTDNVTIHFVDAGKGRYYAKYVVFGEPSTYITGLSIQRAYPIDPNDHVGYSS